jgi:indolepyruvate ferredoxin oxidoreductase
LITHYEATVNDILRSLTLDSYDRAVAIASTPDLVRGYEEVKMRNLGAYLGRLAELGIATDRLSLP